MKKKIALVTLFVLAVAWVSGFWWGPRLEMSMAFPRVGFKPLRLAGEKVDLGPTLAHFRGEPKNGWVIYLHGNGGPIDLFADHVDWFEKRGYAVLSPEYPGYGEAPGRIRNEAQAFALVGAAWAHLTNARKAEPARVLWCGFSIGTGLAVEGAAKHGGKGLVLFAPYTSLLEMGDHDVGFRPQTLWFMKPTFDSATRIAKVTMPVLILHGDADRRIDQAMGRRLSELSAGRPTVFVDLPGCDHRTMLAGPWGEASGAAFDRLWPSVGR